MMKRTVTYATGVAFAFAAMTTGEVIAASAVGTASVRIVDPLSVTEVSSSSFEREYTNIVKDGNEGDTSGSLMVRGSPHKKPITAKSHSDPIMWGEFTITGRNYAQISVSSIQNTPQAIAFSKETAIIGKEAIKVGSNQYQSIDISKPKRLKLSSAVEIKDQHLSGNFQPVYTVALHYE